VVGPKATRLCHIHSGSDTFAVFLPPTFTYTRITFKVASSDQLLLNLQEKLKPRAPNMSQPTSALLRLPAELRHETYSYILPDGIHVRLVRGEIYFSPCLERSHPRPSPHIDGQERRSDKDDVSRWARRLDSSWGPHWMCEEHAMTILNKFDLTLALVCKSM
jgi:hypothetical protein